MVCSRKHQFFLHSSDELIQWKLIPNYIKKEGCVEAQCQHEMLYVKFNEWNVTLILCGWMQCCVMLPQSLWLLRVEYATKIQKKRHKHVIWNSCLIEKIFYFRHHDASWMILYHSQKIFKVCCISYTHADDTVVDCD